MEEGELLRFKCNKCGADMESPESRIGKMEVCPSCKQRMKVEDFALIAERERQKHEARAAAATHEFVCTVARATQDGRTCILNTCQELEPIYLAREPEDPYDRNAIAVYIIRYVARSPTHYRKAGYIISDERAAIAFLMDKGYRTAAFVQRVFTEEEGESVSIEIAVAIYEQ